MIFNKMPFLISNNIRIPSEATVATEALCEGGLFVYS